MVRVSLTPDAFKETIAWLLSREPEIAWDIEDLGQMQGLFLALIGREPIKDKPKISVDDMDLILLERMT